MGDQTLGLILHIQPPQLSKNFTWSAATSSNVIEHIVCFIQDENTLRISSAELCTSACWVSWGFCWRNAQLCQVSRCTLKLCYSVCQLLFLVNMISKFAGSSFCLTVNVEDENTKQHKTPYWLPDAQLITGHQLNMKPLIPTLSAHLPGQFWIYLFSDILPAPKRHCCKRQCQKHCWCWALLHWTLLHLPVVHVASYFVIEDDQVDHVIFTFGKTVALLISCLCFPRGHVLSRDWCEVPSLSLLFLKILVMLAFLQSVGTSPHHHSFS